MRITVFCSDVVYPPNHGGRIDTWSRLQALRNLGVTLQLVIWWLPAEKPDDNQITAMNTVADDVILIKRHRRLMDYLRPTYPPRMYAFYPRDSTTSDVLSRVSEFRPDVCWMEGWHPWLLVRRIAGDLSKRIVYRSQNVEHQYFRFQSDHAKGLRSLVLRLNASRLERVETELRAQVDWVLDISEDDAKFWKLAGDQGKWRVLPPIFRPRELETVEEDVDICFTGNLWAPNNCEGLMWFLESVLPRIGQEVGRKIRMIVAGSSPLSHVKEACRRHGVECIINPDDTLPYQLRSRILVNPIRHSSGVSMKMIEMLATGKTVVSTSPGLRGLPSVLHSFVLKADDSEGFATLCAKELLTPRPNNRGEVMPILNSQFGETRLNNILQMIADGIATEME